MSRESLRHIDNRIVFKETFDSEFQTRRLGGIPTDVDYSNGVGSFNGEDININGYNILLSSGQSYTARLKLKSTDIDFKATSYLLAQNDASNFYLLFTAAGNLNMGGVSDITYYKGSSSKYTCTFFTSNGEILYSSARTNL